MSYNVKSNGKSHTLVEKSDLQHNAVMSTITGWGTMLPEITVFGASTLVLYNSDAYVIWIAGRDGMLVRRLSDNTNVERVDTGVSQSIELTCGAIKVTRNGYKLAICTSNGGNASLAAFYVKGDY